MAKDVKMLYIESDIEKIQTKTNLYLKSYGPAGAAHLVYEAVQNGIDEVTDKNSGGSIVEVTGDLMNGSITVSDDGRGFPEDDYPLEIFCTKMQSGSKFMRDDNTNTAGEFGLGLTAICALSSNFELTSWREKEGYRHTLVFEEGRKTSDVKGDLKKGGIRHGCCVSFIPSKKFLGPKTHIPFDDIEKWLENISYQLDDHVVIKYTLKNGLETVTKKTFKKRDPVELLKRMCSENVLVKPLIISARSTFQEEIVNVKSTSAKNSTLLKDRVADYTMMVAYDDNSDCTYDSYCNFANTIEGGIHVDGAENSFCRYIQAKTKESMTDREKEKIDILWNDVRTGLKMVVMLNTNGNVQFQGNSKEKIVSEFLAPIIRNGFYDAIVEYFDQNPDKLKALVRVVKTNAKVRIEANKIREASTKETMTAFKEHSIQNYIKCSNTGKNEYRELFLMEGLSPQGGAANARDTHTQAILAFRGMTANAYKCSLEELMHPQTGNVEYRRLVNVMRCGIGPTFDINKLYFNKIILFTDADIDGGAISAGIAGFFVYRMPQIVEAGKLYRVVPPLYKLDDKHNPYARTKHEKVEIYRDKIVKNYKIALPGKSVTEYLSKEEFYDFIFDTSEYLKRLNAVADHFKVNHLLVERVAAFFYSKLGDGFLTEDIGEHLSDSKKSAEFISYIQEKFPEMTLHGTNTKMLNGVIDGKYQSLIVGTRLLKKCSSFMDVTKKYGYMIIVYDRKTEEEKVMTIAEFMHLTEAYVSKTLERFKGIGEMSAEDLMDTTMNPNTRMLVRLTLDDLKRDLAVFEKLFGESKQNKADRKQMMLDFVIDRDDLDN